jgi:hypothetical protein
MKRTPEHRHGNLRLFNRKCAQLDRDCLAEGGKARAVVDVNAAQPIQ